MVKSYVIIGSGIAAVTAAKAIRNIDKDGVIKIFGEEKSLPYNRIKLSKELFSDLGSEKVLIKKEKWYEKNNILVESNSKIIRIDSDAKFVVTSNGNQIAYDKLLICTGSNNRQLTIEGAKLKGVYTIRKMWEADEFKFKTENKNHILSIGGGVQGLETAWSLLQAGKKVTIIEVAPRLMARQLDDRTSFILKNKIEEMGVNVYLNTSIERILGEEEVTEVVINGGQVICCDSVLYSIGIQPNIELIENTKIVANRGIIVDNEMKTNIQGIYAAGDVIELNGEIEGLWNSAMEQGKVAGSNMANSNKCYKKVLPITVFKAFGIELFSIGLVDENQCDQSLIEDDGNEKYTRVFINDKRIVGVISLEGVLASIPYNQAIENHILLDGLDLNTISIKELMEEVKKRQEIQV